MRRAAVGILLTLASPAAGFPNRYNAANMLACAGGNCPNFHGAAPNAGTALAVTGKADGGTYTPGETINLANSGGGQYALCAVANGALLGPMATAATTVPAPQSGTLILVGVRAGGQNQGTYARRARTQDWSRAAAHASEPCRGQIRVDRAHGWWRGTWRRGTWRGSRRRPVAAAATRWWRRRCPRRFVEHERWWRRRQRCRAGDRHHHCTGRGGRLRLLVHEGAFTHPLHQPPTCSSVCPPTCSRLPTCRASRSMR